ncbi:hypothetical protein E2C01_102711 [Portunus trituberculatus]|uniref:Uncharacterized protein n=1 Tax=Portunus trituberculatus TaxID=210409 RepID=A0A5B7KI01_PORTR|nr:hypothetical protein [Portunus trituberculatus]
MSVKGKGQYYGTFRPAVSGAVTDLLIYLQAGIIRCQMDGVDLRGASKATCIGKGQYGDENEEFVQEGHRIAGHAISKMWKDFN